MWIIKYQTDLMPDAEIMRETFGSLEDAKTSLQGKASQVFESGRKITWKSDENFSYRSYQDTYSLHYWIEKA